MGWVKGGAYFAVLMGLITFQSASTSAQTPETSTYSLWSKWGPFLDVGGMVGTKRNIGEATLFVPVWQDERSMLFGDFRFKADDQNSREGNFGLGFRNMFGDGWNAGLYGFYDRRRSPNANFFNQFTVGAELLGTNFDFRVNTYWPFGNIQQTVGGPTTGQSTAAVSGTSLMVSTPATMQTYEYAMRGFDAEAGVRVPITPAQSPYALRFYAGGYRFDDASGTVPVVAGPRLRLEFTDYEVKELWGGTRFTISTEWQTDQVRGSQFFAGLRLRVPLQAEPRRSSFTMQERRMTDTIIRDVDIVANTQSIQIAPAITESATQTANGQPITVVNSGTTTGAALPGAVAAAGANSTVVLSGTFNTTAQTTLQAGQTMIGSGLLNVRTASGRTVAANLLGSGTINSNIGVANFTVAMGDYSTLTGMTINATNTTTSNTALAVGANGVNNATISNNVISATNTAASSSAMGVQILNGASNIMLLNNSIRAAGGTDFSIAVNVASASATVQGNALSSTGTGTFSAAVNLNNATVDSGSTGNINSAGICRLQGVNTGTVFFSNGTTCP